MKNKSYYTIQGIKSAKNALSVPSLVQIKANCYRVDFDYEADLCIELETAKVKYRSHGSKCPV